MDGTTVLSVGSWLTVWVLFFLFIRHLLLSEEKHQRLKGAIHDLLEAQKKATNEQKEFHKAIAGLMQGITINLDSLKDVNIENVKEIIRREVDARLKHVAQ